MFMSLNISHSCIQTYIPSVKKEYLLCIYAILISFMCALADQNVGDHFCCWDLDRIGNAIFVDFSSRVGMNDREILVAYNISKGRSAGLELYGSDCLTEAEENVISVFHTQYDPLFVDSTQISNTHEAFIAYVDVHTTNLTNSSIYSYNETTNVGTVEMCLRVDLYLDEDVDGDGLAWDSISFHKTILTINIDMARDFSMYIQADEDEESRFSTNAGVEYDLSACVCKRESRQCTSTTVDQNTIVDLCIFNNNDGFLIDKFQSMILTQSNPEMTLTVTAISNNEASDLTAVTIDDDGKGAIISTRMVSAFFSNDPPPPVKISGVAELSFGRRRAQSEENEASGIFAIDLPLQSETEMDALSVTSSVDMAHKDSQIVISYSLGFLLMMSLFR